MGKVTEADGRGLVQEGPDREVLLSTLDTSLTSSIKLEMPVPPFPTKSSFMPPWRCGRVCGVKTTVSTMVATVAVTQVAFGVRVGTPPSSCDDSLLFGHTAVRLWHPVPSGTWDSVSPSIAARLWSASLLPLEPNSSLMYVSFAASMRFSKGESKRFSETQGGVFWFHDLDVLSTCCLVHL